MSKCRLCDLNFELYKGTDEGFCLVSNYGENNELIKLFFWNDCEYDFFFSREVCPTCLDKVIDEAIEKRSK